MNARSEPAAPSSYMSQGEWFTPGSPVEASKSGLQYSQSPDLSLTRWRNPLASSNSVARCSISPIKLQDYLKPELESKHFINYALSSFLFILSYNAMIFSCERIIHNLEDVNFVYFERTVASCSRQ